MFGAWHISNIFYIELQSTVLNALTKCILGSLLNSLCCFSVVFYDLSLINRVIFFGILILIVRLTIRDIILIDLLDF